MRQVDANVGTGGNGPEGRGELSFMNPDFGIRGVQELVQATSMVEMKMSNDDLLDILDTITGGLNGRTEFMVRLIVHTGEDIRCSWTPDSRIILATTCLPQDQTFMRMLDQDTVHGHLSTFVHKWLAFGALQAGVTTASDKSFVTFQPSDFQDMEFGAWGTDVGYRARDGALLNLILNCGHSGDDGGRGVSGKRVERKLTKP